MNKKWKKYLTLIAICISLATCLTGCSVPFSERTVERVVLTTGFDKEGVFRIGTAVCSIDEFMLYLTNTQNRYEEIYGSEIWSVATANQTLEDKIKDMDNHTLDKILDEIDNSSSVMSVNISGGEPMLHPRFAEVIKRL